MKRIVRRMGYLIDQLGLLLQEIGSRLRYLP